MPLQYASSSEDLDSVFKSNVESSGPDEVCGFLAEGLHDVSDQ